MPSKILGHLKTNFHACPKHIKATIVVFSSGCILPSCDASFTIFLPQGGSQWSSVFFSTSSSIDLCNLSFLVDATLLASDSFDRPLGSYADFAWRASLKIEFLCIQVRMLWVSTGFNAWQKTRVTNNKFHFCFAEELGESENENALLVHAKHSHQ